MLPNSFVVYSNLSGSVFYCLGVTWVGPGSCRGLVCLLNLIVLGLPRFAVCRNEMCFFTCTVQLYGPAPRGGVHDT